MTDWMWDKAELSGVVYDDYLPGYGFRAAETAEFPAGQALEYLTLGLAGEAGEVANKIKKVIRDHDGEIDEKTADAILDELGDICWYVAMLAARVVAQAGYGKNGAGLGDFWAFDYVLKNNLKKLADRKERKQIKGDGDVR